MVTAIKEKTRKEQLKVAFVVLMKDMLNKIGVYDFSDNVHQEINYAADSMIKEVSIRTYLK